jgi:predicted O-linked N-acetylglucosamine transferase (SPINDLY family)
MNAGDLQRLRDKCAQTPFDPQLWSKLGLLQKQHGQVAEAIEAYRASLALDPTQYATWANLARALRERGDLPGAIEAFRRSTAERASFAEGHSMLSNALREHGALNEALASARTAIALRPDLQEGHLNEGAALHLLGQTEAAMLSDLAGLLLGEHTGLRQNYQRARAQMVSLPPSPVLGLVLRIEANLKDEAALRELGTKLLAERRLPTAEIFLRRAYALGKAPEVALLVAFIERHLGRNQEAESILRDGLAHAPENAALLMALGAYLKHVGRISDARPIVARALASGVETPELLLDAASLHGDFCEHSENAALCARAVALAPERPELHSAAIFSMHYDPKSTPEARFSAHLAYGKRFEVGAERPLPVDRRADRPLRVGYVSADFRAHPTAHFIEPVLRHHRAEQVEAYLYSDAPQEDSVTAHLRRQVRHFRDTSSLSHAELAARVREDEIDILVDLAGHTAGNRLPAFIARPAPIQVSWIGYFATTGLSCMDYRIADELSVPESAAHQFVEQVVRLPHSANAFMPLAPLPPVAALPMERNGYCTFGAFVQPAKLNQDVVEAMAQILLGAKGSRLVLKYGSFADVGLVEHTRRRFAAAHVDPRRIRFEGHAALSSYLEALSQLDVALDTFPYSGETSAIHALLMGAPVVSLAGPALYQQLGARVLRLTGLGDWVTTDRAGYVARAVHAASEPAALKRVREGLRGRVTDSPLFDHRGVTHALEAAYRSMWQRVIA